VSDDDPPVLSRSPRGTIIVRVKRRTQVAVAKYAAAPLLKWIGGLLAVVAGAGLWRC
jgi:hypothetical protein